MIQNAVTAVIPGSRVAHRFTVLRTSDGKLKFRSDRTVGLYDTKTGRAWYSSRGKSDAHLRNQAKEVKLTTTIVDAFEKVAVLSDGARSKIGI